MKEKTALYRHFDCDGVLLYVGISKNPVARMSQHFLFAEWFRQISSIKIEWLETREAAERHEMDAIKKEKPKYNRVHNRKPRSPVEKPEVPAIEEVVSILDDRGYLYISPQAIMDAVSRANIPDVARETGLPYNTVKNVIERRNPTLKTLEKLQEYFDGKA